MGPFTREEAPGPPFCLWRLLFKELPQWTSSAQAHEDSVSLHDDHQRPVQKLQEVGLLVSPIPTTQDSGEQSPGTSVGLFVSPFLTTQGS